MMITDMATGLPQVKGGKVRALGVSTCEALAADARVADDRGSGRSRATTWASGSPRTCRPTRRPPSSTKLHDVLIEATKGPAMQQYYTHHRHRSVHRRRRPSSASSRRPSRRSGRHHQEGRHRAGVSKRRSRRGAHAADEAPEAVTAGMRHRCDWAAARASRAIGSTRPSHLAEHGELDYLVLECLAERTIALAQLRRRRDPASGYDTRLTERIESLLPILTRRGIRLVSNFGAANPLAAADADRRHRAPPAHPGQGRRGHRRRRARRCSTSTRRRWKAAFRCRTTRRSCRPTRTSAPRRCCPRSRAAPTSWSPVASPTRRCSSRR